MLATISRMLIICNSGSGKITLAELALQHAKDVLDLGVNLAEATVCGTMALGKIAARFRPLFHAPQHARRVHQPAHLCDMGRTRPP